jgi:hypothetical protein
LAACKNVERSHVVELNQKQLTEGEADIIFHSLQACWPLIFHRSQWLSHLCLGEQLTFDIFGLLKTLPHQPIRNDGALSTFEDRRRDRVFAGYTQCIKDTRSRTVSKNILCIIQEDPGRYEQEHAKEGLFRERGSIRQVKR